MCAPCFSKPNLSFLHFSAARKDGYAIHLYTASVGMDDSCLANADGDFLIVPQLVSSPCSCLLSLSYGCLQIVTVLSPTHLFVLLRCWRAWLGSWISFFGRLNRSAPTWAVRMCMCMCPRTARLL